MRNLTSTALSMMAMSLSSLTTYLTFFDDRYAVTTATAKAELSVQTGGSTSDGVREVYYRPYLSVTQVLTNRGTVPIVLTELQLVASESTERCEAGDGKLPSQVPLTIVEEGSLQTLQAEFGFELIEATAKADGTFDLPDQETLWCLAWTLLDHNGKRIEKLTELTTVKLNFPAPEPDDWSPPINVDMDTNQSPINLARRGIF